MTHGYPAAPWEDVQSRQQRRSEERCERPCFSLFLAAHLHECVNVCRAAAAVFALCNPEQAACSGSIPGIDGCQRSTSLLNIT